MPRIARKKIITKFSHIIVQGINKTYIFEEDYFKELYLNLLRENLKNTNLELLSYCIMGNHAHMLIYSDNREELSKFMHKVDTKFAMRYNNKKERVGYVFRNRFYLQPIFSQKQLYNCLVYIHRNPIKAHIVLNYEDYKYSSYKEFLGQKNIITPNGIELIFNSLTNFREKFEQIHKNNTIDDIDDICEYTDSNIIIKNFLQSYGKSMEKLKKDKKKLKEVFLKLKNEGGLSLRKIEGIFNIGKDTIRKIIKE